MRDLLDTVEFMTDQEAGLLLKAIIAHVDKEQITLPRELQFAFVPIRNQLSRDCEKYENFIEKQRVNGAKGGRPKKPNGLIENPENPSLSEETQKTLTVTDTDNDINLKTTPSSKMNGQVPVQKIVDLYHQMLPTLPRIEKVTPKRAGYIRQRWREDLPALKNWENFYDYVSQSAFLMGKVQPTNGRKPFIANLEWITNQTNFAKILEEHYHGV